jgi:hypothetical protein
MGQGAVLRLWEYEDGRTGGPLAAEVDEAEDTNSKERAERRRVAQEEVDRCAAVVRDLKENQGLGNADEQVKEAVAELLAAKAALEAL